MSNEVGNHVSALAFFARYPLFTRYQIARFAAVAAWQMQSVGVGWLVFSRTHDPLALGLVGLMQFVPALLFSVVGGLLADRFERRKVVAIGHTFLLSFSAILAVLAVRPALGVAPVYAVLVLLGLARAFVGPASQALAPTLVPSEAFPRAVALGSVLTNTSMLLGPAIGGQIYALYGTDHAHGARTLFIACGVLFSFTVTLVGTMPVTSVPDSAAEAPWIKLLAGIRYVGANRAVLGAISLDLFAVLLGGAVALLPIMANQILHVGAREFGRLRSAEALGSIAMAVLMAAVPIKRHAGKLMLGCVFCFGLTTVAFGVSRSYALSLGLLFCLGVFDMVSVAVRSSLVQLQTPDAMRGRVSAVSMVFITASNELGQFESGVTAKWFGTVPAVVIGGIGTCLVVVVWALLFPELRRFASLSQREPPAT